MELQVVRPAKITAEEDIIFTDVTDAEIPPATSKGKERHFIEANTSSISLQHLKKDCTVPVFSKDNECTIAHQEFIEAVYQAAMVFTGNHSITPPEIRVSHVVKGRIPEAIGKPANDLLDHEKTIYYERMAFIMEVPSITEKVNGNELALTIGGVRAYNHENLYSKKSVEKFKVFIGFKNRVCTNLCVSTDGYADEIRVSHVDELHAKAIGLFRQYNPMQHLKGMDRLSHHFLTEHQFAQLVGKARLYHYLPKEQKAALPAFEFNDGHVNVVARDYYQDLSFCKEGDGTINLWKCYNLFTGANKSSYIDTFLSRTVNAYTFSQGIARALQGDEEYRWFLN